MSVKDAQYSYRDTRILTVLQGVVQIRLLALVSTTGVFLLAILLAVAARIRGSRGNTHEIRLPSSQLDWIVEAAREHARNHPDAAKVDERPYSSPDEYASRNRDNFFFVSSHLDPSMMMMATELSGSGIRPSPMESDAWAAYMQNSQM